MRRTTRILMWPLPPPGKCYYCHLDADREVAWGFWFAKRMPFCFWCVELFDVNGWLEPELDHIAVP